MALLCCALLPIERGMAEFPDISSVAPDLSTPPMTEGDPAPGKRVKQVAPEYDGTGVYHALYLPADWEPGKRYPVIVEYAGNGPYTNSYGDVSDGTPEGSDLGYGISGGKGFIWICMPFIAENRTAIQRQWWGDIEATKAYCTATVERVCRDYGGDPKAVILAGFSRGAIACNFIGLHDEQIAGLWRGFIAYSHYDGVRAWNYTGSDRASALVRLKRLRGRPSFICHETSVEETRRYLEGTGVNAPFTLMAVPFRNHNDAWVLRPSPARKALREWLRKTLNARTPMWVMGGEPGTPNDSGAARASSR